VAGVGRVAQAAEGFGLSEFKLPADLNAPALARTYVAEAAGEEGAEDLVLLTSEVVSNAVRHSGIHRAGEILLRVEPHENDIRVEVLDPGNGFLRSSMPPGGHADRWGLFLVDRLSKSWGAEREGARTMVWFELARG
jgi:anti-sigma regulatory factor (Ser/Thr protein kinase)